MKRLCVVALVLVTMTGSIFADSQVRFAANSLTPVATLPSGGLDAWRAAVVPSGRTMSGWNWEIIFDHLGFGMHYGMRIYDTIEETGENTVTQWFVNWKGDFFLSYHFFGGGSVVDPFVEVGWGNVGTSTVQSADYTEYPVWKDEVRHGTAIDLALFSYAAAGVALDLNGLLLGAKVSYLPSEMIQPAPDSGVDRYDLLPFEISLFGGVALGGHRHPRWR